MKVQSLSCPNCGADIEYNGRIAFCPYCGKKLLIDDGAKRVEINKSVSINSKHERITRDETRIREAEAKSKSDKYAFYCIGSLLVFIFLMFVFLEFEDAFHPNDIKIPVSASKYVGENYEEVVLELEELGFNNIKLTPTSPGWLDIENHIKKISINGNSSFTAGTWVPKNSVIRITYYSSNG